MRMRPHVHACAQQKFSRTHLIEENEWPDHLSLAGWERPPYGKAAEVSRTWHDDHVDRVAGKRIAGLGIEGRLPTHVPLIAMIGRFLTLPRSTIRWNVFRPYKSPLGVSNGHHHCDELRSLCARSGR